MLQETLFAAAAGGTNAANALSQMGFEHMISEMINKPGEFIVSWVVLLTLVIMSAMSWYWTVINVLRSTRLKGQADRVTSAFWETPNAQDAIRLMEEQPKNEPFSKIALDAAQAAAHHQDLKPAPVGRRHQRQALAATLPGGGQVAKIVLRVDHQKLDVAGHGLLLCW